jgi:hypothetical protein
MTISSYLKNQCPRSWTWCRQQERHEVGERGQLWPPPTHVRGGAVALSYGTAEALRSNGGGVCRGDFRAAWSRSPLELCIGEGEELNWSEKGTGTRAASYINSASSRCLHCGHRVPSDFFFAVQIQQWGLPRTILLPHPPYCYLIAK